MASGWEKDGAVQDQIDASIEDAVQQARSRIPVGESRMTCEECGVKIPEARRNIIPGVRFCVRCQEANDTDEKNYSPINRRGSKDSQLR